MQAPYNINPDGPYREAVANVQTLISKGDRNSLYALSHALETLTEEQLCILRDSVPVMTSELAIMESLNDLIDGERALRLIARKRRKLLDGAP